MKAEQINEILASGRIQVRKQAIFKIDADRNDLENDFIQTFVGADRTFDKFINLPEYKQVIDWLLNNEGKGLFLTGSYGRGKSVIVNSVIPILFQIYHNKVLTPVAARNLYRYTDYVKQWAYVIDDIGQESLSVKDFGTTDYPVINIISECEDKMKLLILSSNLDKAELTAKYGERIVDRINRLCKVVPFSGKSLRK